MSRGRSPTSRQVSRCEGTPLRSAGTRPRHPQSPFPPRRGGHTGPAHPAPALGPRGSGLAVRPQVHPLPPRGLGQGRPRSEAGGPWLSSVEGAPQALWSEGRDPRGVRGAPHPRTAATQTPPLTSAWEPPGRSKDGGAPSVRTRAGGRTDGRTDAGDSGRRGPCSEGLAAGQQREDFQGTGGVRVRTVLPVARAPQNPSPVVSRFLPATHGEGRAAV